MSVVAPTLVDLDLLRAGDVVAVGPFTATIYPDIDFETRGAAGYVWNGAKWESLPGLSAQNRGLKAVGSRNYVCDASFSLLALSYNLKDGRGRIRWNPGISGLWPAPPQDLLDHVARGGIIEAVNVMFEWTVWNFYCVPALGWPVLHLHQLRCVAAKARSFAYPGGLEDMGTVLRLPPQLMKDPKGSALVRKLTVPRNPTKGNREMFWTPFTATEEFRQFYDYNEQDIAAEAAASARIPDLTPREMSIWQMDFRINARGMQVSMSDVENCIAIIEQAYARYNGRLAEITNGAVKGSTEVAKTLAWMAATHGVHLTELDEETVEEALTHAYPAALLEVLRIRQLLAFGSVRKLYAFRSHSTPLGRLHDQYVYSAAHTKLWNGRAVQPANLYKGSFSHPQQVEMALAVIASRKLDVVEAAYGDALELVASCLRSLIIAKPGHKLISSDFKAIQAVVTAALAGEEWQLEVFRTHGMIYEAFASKLTGNPLQFYIDYKRQHKKHHEHRQSLGKIPSLASGFGAWIGGWKRFGADKLGDDAYIKSLILQVRREIPMTVELWGGQTRNKFNRDNNGQRAEESRELYGLEGAAISAVLSPGQCFGYRGVAFQMYEDTLYCQPPSGGFMQYHSPRLRPSTRDYATPWEMELVYWGWNTNPKKGRGGWEEMKLYGGVLTQNSVANISREVQADSLLALDTHQPREYPIVMHTHDEGVAEVPDRPEYSTKEYTQIVRDSLAPWARTPDDRPWPINVPEAWEAYRYGKWED